MTYLLIYLALNEALARSPRCISNDFIIYSPSCRETVVVLLSKVILPFCGKVKNFIIQGLLTSKLNIELKKKFVSYVWSIALYGSETCTLRKLEWKYLAP
jgi:hypothetical protein